MRLPDDPDDFRVDELPLYPASGEGNHTFVRVEKRMRTTEEVARVLARAAGAKPRDVGYAGRKDRVAVATQWFSVPGLEPERALACEADGMRVLEARRHPHKLRTEHLRGNAFQVTLRGVGADQRARAAERLAVMSVRGMPNAYGPQRFGRAGNNAERGRALLRGPTPRGSRREQRFLLSALQSAVFNEVLAARAGAWDVLEAGDVAVIHASGGLFVVEDLERESPRAETFEISPTGPIFGTRVLEPTGAVREREDAALRAWGVDLANLRPPPGVRLRGGRRALRVRPLDTRVSETADGTGVRLDFTLPAGSYASVLVDEVFRAPSAHDIAGPSGVCSDSHPEDPR